MKFFKRLGAATGVMALLVSGLVGFATPAQAAIISDVGSNKGTYSVNFESAAREGFEGIYARSQIQAGRDLWSDADCLESVRLMVDKNKLNKKSYVVDEAGTQEFTKTAQGGTDGWCYISLNLAPADQCNEDKGWWSGEECLFTLLGDPTVGDVVLTDPPPGARWTGNYECFEAPKPPGNWIEANVPDCSIPSASSTRSVDANAWAEYEADEPLQEFTPPPPCWDASINNCPVGGALRFAAPEYAMVGVPVTMYAYASWRPDANSPAQPTDGTAVIRVDGEDYSGVEFVDGVAEWRFIPETEGMKEFTASGVLFSGLSGANAYIDTVEARTYVLEYDPAAYATALKNKRVEVGDTYVITDPNQARSYAEGRYEWSVSEKSDGVCAVYETKKGAVKAKFTDSGKCTVIWLDKESEESGKYTFIAKK